MATLINRTIPAAFASLGSILGSIFGGVVSRPAARDAGNRDMILFALAIALAFTGLIALYPASAVVAERELGDPDVFPPDLNRIYRQSYVEVLESGQPVFSIIPYELERRSVGNYHRLLLPFTDSRSGAGTCDFILLSFQSVPLERN